MVAGHSAPDTDNELPVSSEDKHRQLPTETSTARARYPSRVSQMTEEVAGRNTISMVDTMDKVRTKEEESRDDAVYGSPLAKRREDRAFAMDHV